MITGWLNRMRGKSAVTEKADSSIPTLSVRPDTAQDGGQVDAEPITAAIGRYLLRQPVLDKSQRIIGYEFALRNQLGVDVSEPTQVLSDETLLSSVVQLGLQNNGTKRQIFISVGPGLLNSGWIGMLPSDMVVLMIDAARIDRENIDTLLETCAARAAGGFQLGIDGFRVQEDDLLPLLDCVHWLRFDLRSLDAIAFSHGAEELHRHRQLRIIATNIESHDDILAASHLGFDAFQGYYFATRNPLAPPRMDNDRVRVMELLNMAASKAPHSQIEQAIKHDVLLSYRLLVYINSPLNPLTRKIESIAQALIYLGYDPLYRWLTLLLYARDQDSAPGDLALLQNALVRGRIMELLGQRYMTPEEADGLFVTGMFSLLDVLLNVPMQEALVNLSLSDAVMRALLQGHGPFAPFLRLAMAFENADQQQLKQIADDLALDAAALNSVHFMAINWAMQLGTLDGQ